MAGHGATAALRVSLKGKFIWWLAGKMGYPPFPVCAATVGFMPFILWCSILAFLLIGRISGGCSKCPSVAGGWEGWTRVALVMITSRFSLKRPAPIRNLTHLLAGRVVWTQWPPKALLPHSKNTGQNYKGGKTQRMGEMCGYFLNPSATAVRVYSLQRE